MTIYTLSKWERMLVRNKGLIKAMQREYEKANKIKSRKEGKQC